MVSPQFCFFLLVIIRSGHLAEIKWFVCLSKSQRSLCVSFSGTDVGLCIYHLFVWSNWNFLHNFQWITLPAQSCLVLYSFGTDLLQSLIIWLMVSSLLPHLFRLYYRICRFVASNLILLWYDCFLWRCIEFNTPVLTSGLSQGPEWHQVFLVLRDSSEYSTRFQQCCGLYSFDSTFDF